VPPNEGINNSNSSTAAMEPVLQINTSVCAHTFFPAAHSQGVVLWEPFGGLCAGLEMVLRNGFTVAKYIYSDIDPLAQRVAAHRIRMLSSMYPNQLSEAAIAGYANTLPMDVTVGSSNSSYSRQAMDGCGRLAVSRPLFSWTSDRAERCQVSSVA
jgi:hypothetical protein